MELTWSQITVPGASNAVAWGGDRFVAVGYGGADSDRTSTDGGLTWSGVSMTGMFSYDPGLDVAYGNGVWVAVGPDAIASSTNGTSWTGRTEPVAQYWSGVAYGGGVFVGVAEGMTGDAMTSPDGATWTRRALPATSTDYGSVAYGNGAFVAVSSWNGVEGTNSTYAASSPDGITWTARAMPFGAGWIDVAFGAGLFVAVARGTGSAPDPVIPTSAFATSPDGITWTARTFPAAANWSAVAFANGIFLATARDNDVYATSTDGITWTTHQLPLSGYWLDVAGSDDGTFIIVGETGKYLRGVMAPPVPNPFWTSHRNTYEVP